MKSNSPTITSALQQEKMSEIKLKQLEYESDHWKRLLGFMTEANIQNKNSISRLLKDRLNETSLANIEMFHSKFLTEDNVISVLRNDIAELDKMLSDKKFDEEKIPEEVYNKLQKVRDTITRAEEQFNILKKDFNRFLSEYIFYS